MAGEQLLPPLPPATWPRSLHRAAVKIDVSKYRTQLIEKIFPNGPSLAAPSVDFDDITDAPARKRGHPREISLISRRPSEWPPRRERRRFPPELPDIAGKELGFAGTYLDFLGSCPDFPGTGLDFAGTTLGFAGRTLNLAGKALGFAGNAPRFCPERARNCGNGTRVFPENPRVSHFGGGIHNFHSANDRMAHNWLAPYS